MLSTFIAGHPQAVPNQQSLFNRIEKTPTWAFRTAEIVAIDRQEEFYIVEVTVPVIKSGESFINAGVRVTVEGSIVKIDEFEMSWGDEAQSFSGYFLKDRYGYHKFQKGEEGVQYLTSLWKRIGYKDVAQAEVNVFNRAA